MAVPNWTAENFLHAEPTNPAQRTKTSESGLGLNALAKLKVGLVEVDWVARDGSGITKMEVMFPAALDIPIRHACAAVRVHDCPLLDPLPVTPGAVNDEQKHVLLLLEGNPPGALQRHWLRQLGDDRVELLNYHGVLLTHILQLQIEVCK